MYDFTPRNEVQVFVPDNVKRVLDIGCSRGAFGEAVKKSRGCEVWGIEIDPLAAEDARTRLDKVLVGDARDIIDASGAENFDCIVCNDVLEHVAQPEVLLQILPKWLSDAGCVVASIPNIRYFKALRDILFRAEFKYQDDGIFDRTHLRFFTRKSMIRLFEENGFEILKIEGVNRKSNLLVDFLNLLFLNGLWDTRFLQFVIVARPTKRGNSHTEAAS